MVTKESSGDIRVTIDDVRAAARRLDGLANPTPVLHSRSFDARSGTRAFLKCENFQRTGSFKFRGAYNALSLLPSDRRLKGVLGFSSGNHAQALSLAGRLLGVPVTIIMPDDAPEVKRAATEGYGATIMSYSRASITREELAERMSADLGLPVVPPYDHPDVVAGQGTVGLEILDQAPDIDTLVVCCGGGGLLSGCATAIKAVSPDIRVVGVEPEHADDATRSFRSGSLVTIRDPDTIADGARTPSLGRITFPIVLTLVDDMVTVSEKEIVETMRFLWERLKIVVEPTGALAAAAVLFGKIEGGRTGVVITGGNVDLSRALRLFSST